MLICEVLDRETVVASAVGHIPNGAPLTRLLHVDMRVHGQNYGIGEKTHISRKIRQKIHENFYTKTPMVYFLVCFFAFFRITGTPKNDTGDTGTVVISNSSGGMMMMSGTSPGGFSSSFMMNVRNPESQQNRAAERGVVWLC